jgi:hypothetical protein
MGLMLLAPFLSLWLDEVLTLTAAVEPTLSALLENLRLQQGATPLAFLVPRWSIQLLGNSLLSARLPSILASAASMPALYLIARRIGLVRPWLAILLFAAWPLHLRYALEVRPYALALCLTLWLTHALLEEWHPAIYTLLTLAIGLTHPYALVIPAAHALWSRTRGPVIAIGVTVAALVPWYAHFGPGWREQVQLTVWNPGAITVFLREITGSGYVGAALLFALLALGIQKAPPPRQLWILTIALPIIAVPLANIAFDYFFAVRQLIYILPALVILMAAARGWIAYTLSAAFLVAACYSNTMWLLHPREDWQAAAAVVSEQVSQGACVRFVSDSAKLFAYFRPELRDVHCTGSRVVLASSTYEPTHAATAAALERQGYSRQSTRTFNGPIIEVWAK